MKYFTLEQAEKLLPVIKQQLIILKQIKDDFEAQYAKLRVLKKQQPLPENQIFELECKIEFLQIEANTHIQNIHSQGVQLKDIDIGLIDFPALLFGKEVLLCWKMGETAITHYHGMDEGFMGRKKL